MDCSPPGSSVGGILQARTREWVAISFSRGSSWPRDRTWVSCVGKQLLYCRTTGEALLTLLLLFSHSVESDSLQPHGLQHPRLPCLSPSPGAWSNSCPLSWWCHQTISSSLIPFFSCLQSFPALGSFTMSQLFASGGQVLELQLQHQCFQWIFRTDFLSDWLVWFPCHPRDSQESSPTLQFKRIYSSMLSLLYGPTLTSIHDYRKNHSFDYTDLCWQSNVSAFQNAV